MSVKCLLHEDLSLIPTTQIRTRLAMIIPILGEMETGGSLLVPIGQLAYQSLSSSPVRDPVSNTS